MDSYVQAMTPTVLVPRIKHVFNQNYKNETQVLKTEFSFKSSEELIHSGCFRLFGHFSDSHRNLRLHDSQTSITESVCSVHLTWPDSSRASTQSLYHISERSKLITDVETLRQCPISKRHFKKSLMCRWRLKNTAVSVFLFCSLLTLRGGWSRGEC